MIWGPDGKRLSKRHGAASVQEYEEMGYLPEAVLNYLSLLGWSLDGETTVIDKDTLVESFSLDRISKNPAVLDNDKLEWLNGVYIRELSSDELVARMLPWLEEAGLSSANDVASRKEWFLELAVLVSERIRRMDELVPTVRFLFEDVPTAEEARDNVLAKEGSARALAAVAETLSVLPTWDAAAIEKALRSVPAEVELKGKQVFQATRVAATGTTVSPPLFESLALLGRERTLERIDAAQGLATA
jgi:glutamyl-tRNA synthetase